FAGLAGVELASWDVGAGFRGGVADVFVAVVFVEALHALPRLHVAGGGVGVRALTALGARFADSGVAAGGGVIRTIGVVEAFDALVGASVAEWGGVVAGGGAGGCAG